MRKYKKPANLLKLIKRNNLIIKKIEMIKQSFQSKEGERLVQAIKFFENRINFYSNLKQLNHYENEISALNSSVELLSHELMLALKKGQLKYKNNKDNSNLNSISQSQLGQDVWVLHKTNFKKKGYFVEFGASDGVKLSNTFALETGFGWTGLCIEPDLTAYENLIKNRNCQCSNDLIGGVTGENVEFIHASSFSAITNFSNTDSHSEKRLSFKKLGYTSVLKTISLNDELIKYECPKTIDYMSIDTEGSEYYILKKFKFSDWDIKLLTIEHNFTENRTLIRDLMKFNGYDFVEVNWDDWYYKD